MRYLTSQTIFLLILGLFICQQGFSGDLTFHNRISYGKSSTEIIVGNAEAVANVYVESGAGSYTDLNIRNFITLGIDHDITLTDYSIEAYILEVDVEISPYISGTPGAVFTETLAISYDPFTGLSYQDKDIYRFLGNDSIDFEITEIRQTINGSTAIIDTLPNNVFVDGDIIVNRIGNFHTVATNLMTFNTPAFLDLDCDPANAYDGIRISWNTTPEAAEYQLEWTFINNYDGDTLTHAHDFGQLDSTLLDYNFRNNSTRISTVNNYYDIPLVFENGYIIWRVRGVGYDPTTDPTQPIFGYWSETTDAGALDTFLINNSNAYLKNLSPHEVNKNWQLTTTFAEEGKKKEVISYYDGSLRNRQSVTVVNTDNNVIVGQTIYDHQGRPAINVLPVPVIRPHCSTGISDTSKASIKYYTNFNQDTTGEGYSKDNFDLDTSACQTPHEPMSVDTGASLYYSQNNPNKEAHQAYVPEANGYPYTQVEYTPDNTGRIRRQSGVGEDFQLGSGHESKYYYGKALQINLDRLFGSEVGYAAHYKKNVVIDPNGQINVTYLDQEGRTIATALAGEAPSNLSEIESLKKLKSAGGTDLTADLFEKDPNGTSRNNTRSVGGNSIDFSQELLISSEGLYTFNYNLENDPYSDSCTPSICFNCVYDLRFTLTDECGALVVDTNGDTVEYIIPQGYFDTSGGQIIFTTSCDSGTYNDSILFTAELAAGNYTINKTLTLNSQVIASAFQTYLDSAINGECIDSLGAFKAEALANLDLSGCDVSCDECVENLGELDDFVSEGRGTVEDYNELLKQCNAPCTEPTFCETMFKLLAGDMMPGGQYGKYLVNGTLNVSSYQLSVYNSNNILPYNSSNTPTVNWQNPSATIDGTTYDYYLDENGDSAKVFLTIIGVGANITATPEVLSTTNDIHYDQTLGIYYTYPDKLAHVDDFIESFEPSWAQSLVIYHPEYCNYENCITFEVENDSGISSEDFDVLLRTSTSLQDAVNKGLFELNGADYDSKDPYVTGSTVSTYGPDLVSSYEEYATVNSTTYSMFELAAITARCGNNIVGISTTAMDNCAADFNTGTTEQKENDWQSFIGLYLGKKKELQKAELTDNDCINDCIGNEDFNPISSGMWQATAFASWFNNAYFNDDYPCSIFRRGLYVNKVKRFAFGSDIEDLANANNAGHSIFTQTGQCPKAFYLQALLNDLVSDSLLTTDSTDLFAYVSYGGLYSDASNPQAIRHRLWDVITANDTLLTIEIADTAAGITCDFSLEADSIIIGWDSIVGFAQLKALNANDFTVVVKFNNDSIDTLSGSVSCFTINDCRFDKVCEPNEIAKTVQELFNLMLVEGVFHSTTADVIDNVSPYDLSATPAFLNLMGQSSLGSITWKYGIGGTNPNELGEFSSSTVDFTFEVESKYPTGFSAYNDIDYFNNITPIEDSTFTIEAYNSSGILIATLTIVATINDDAYLMGTCEYPNNMSCNQEGHKVMDDFTALIEDLFVNANPAVSDNFNPYLSQSFTSLLASYFGNNNISDYELDAGSAGETSYDTLTIYTYNDVDDTICVMEFNFTNTTIATDFWSIVGVNHVEAVGDLNNNQYNNIEIEAVFEGPVAGTFDTVTIHGSTCLPLLNCDTCTPVVDTIYDTIATTYLSFGGSREYSQINSSDRNLLNVGTFEAWIKTASPSTNTQVITGKYDTLSRGNAILIEDGKLSFKVINQSDINHTQLTNQAINDGNWHHVAITVNSSNEYKIYIDGTLDFSETFTGALLPLTVTDVRYLGKNMSLPIGGTYYNGALKEFSIWDHSRSAQQIYDDYIKIAPNINESGLVGYFPLNEGSGQTLNDLSSLEVDGFRGFTTNAEINDSPWSNDTIIDTVYYEIPCVDTTDFPFAALDSLLIDTSRNACEEQAINIANLNAEIAYQKYIDSLAIDFIENMREHCLNPTENLVMNFNETEYHYTLYYYDQAGNLVKTIPPEGVEVLKINDTSDALYKSIQTDRLNNTQTVFTSHRLETKYKYNSLNQLTHQRLPDHDGMDIFTFSEVQGLDASLEVHAIHFINEAKGYLTGGTSDGRGVLYTTEDGGQTWQKVNYTIGANLKAVEWKNNDTAYAVGSEGILVYTTNGGFTWQMINTYGLDITSSFNDVNSSDTSGVYAVGDQGTIVKITGITPSVLTFTGDPIYNTDNIVSVGVSNFANMVLSINRLENGKRYGTGFIINDLTTSPVGILYDGNQFENITDIQAIDADHLVAVSNYGQIAKSTDGGDNWFMLPVDSKLHFNAVYFSNPEEGIAVRSDGAIHATKDSGYTWTILDDSKFYKGLYAYEDEKVLAFGNDGAAARVIMSAGTNFGVIPYNTGSTDDFSAGWFGVVGTKEVIILSDGTGDLYFTNDASPSGSSWTTVATSVNFPQQLEGHVSGSDVFGVLRNGSTNGSYGFKIDGTTYTELQIAGLQVSSVDKSFDDTKFYFHDQLTGNTYEASTSSIPSSVTNSGFGSTITTPLANMDNYGNGNFVFGAQDGTIKNTIGTHPAIIRFDQTVNIRPLPLSDHGIINNRIHFVGENGTVIRKESGSECLIIGTNDTENYHSLIPSGSSVSNIGVVVGDNGLVNIYDGSFIPQKIATNLNDNFYSVAADSTSNKVYLGASNGGMYYISDISATTPSLAKIPSNNTKAINGIDVSPSGEVLYVGDESRIFKGKDNFAYEIKNNYTPVLRDVHFSSLANGHVVGDDYTLRQTIDGGLTWSVVLPDSGFASGVDTLNAVHTFGAGDAMVVGDDAYVATITNQTAVESSTLPVGFTEHLYGIEFIDQNNGIVVGGDGTTEVLMTDDKGATAWDDLNPTGTDPLKAAYGFANNSYVAVGENGTIRYITDDPSVTDISGSITSEDLNDVFFYDNKTGYIVGDTGTLIKSTYALLDAVTNEIQSITWSTKSTDDEFSAVAKNINAVSFPSRYQGVVGGKHTSSPDNYARIIKDESDEFSTYFWYDRLSRVAVSQNSKQYNASIQRYSYTLYDELGRVVEAGEKQENTTSTNKHKHIFGTYVGGLYNPKTIDDAKLAAWLNDSTGARIEVTRSFYDLPATNFGIAVPSGFTQNEQNMRKRISAITYEKAYDHADSNDTYDYGTLYEYDIHGNVKTLIQDNKTLEDHANANVAALQYKRMDYTYDLISGNVHEVAYQAGEADAWYHRYEYDGDNRITTVETSADYINWDRDAKYIYYDHGPLARIELGENNVQGLDYAYTLQGWLKGVNSDLLNPENDPGRDALSDGDNPNALFARDVMGFSLHYRENDYSAIDYVNKWQENSDRFASVFKGTSDAFTARENLYNGNIANMVTTISKPNYDSATNTLASIDVLPQATAYRYDQLNRIAQARAYQNIVNDSLDSNYNTWDSTGMYDSLYFNAFTYDASGNILTQVRHDQNGFKIEDLVYHYGDNNGKRLQNRLYSVSDFAEDFEDRLHGDDIEDMGFTSPLYADLNNGNQNYQYDEIGQLIQNKQEGIREIIWRVDNKIKAIIREPGFKSKNVIFEYDPMGNRIAKHNYGNNTTLFDPENPTNWETSTYYRRDAQGNVMAAYNYYIDTAAATTSYSLIERNIYGSSRLGMNRDSIEMIAATVDTVNYAHTVGEKRYELSNHLGNVLNTISDKKIVHIEPDTLKLKNHTWTDLVGMTVTSNNEIEKTAGAGWGNGGAFSNESFPAYCYVEREIVDENNDASYSEQWDVFVGLSHDNPDAGPFSIDYAWYNDVNHYLIYENGTRLGPYGSIAIGDKLKVERDNGQVKYYINDALIRTTTEINPGAPLYLDASLYRTNTKAFNVEFYGIDPDTNVLADIKTYSDYSPFGVELYDRTGTVDTGYRYGFQGQEHDEEVLDYVYEYTEWDSVTDTTYKDYLSFDGVSDFVDCGSVDRNITDNLSIEAWIRTTANSTFSNPDVIVSDYQFTGYHLLLRDGKVALEGRNGNDNIYKRAISTQTVNDGEWHHVVGVADLNDTWHIYVDGVLANAVDYNIPNPNFTNTNHLYISRIWDGRFKFEGDIRDVSLWNRVRSAGEVYYDYKTGHPAGNESGLVAYYPLNEGSGTTATDLSPTGINGTIYGATWQSETIIDTNLIGLDSIRVPNRATTSAEFWQYSSRIGRRWNIDPIYKDYESPYVAFANNPVWIIDPNGADSIFYDQCGTESRRVKMDGNHKYFLSHNDGNLCIKGGTFYEGYSYASFFGDQDRNENQDEHGNKVNLFNHVNQAVLPNVTDGALGKYVGMFYDGENRFSFYFNTMKKGASKFGETSSGKFDIKNNAYFQGADKNGGSLTNLETAYLIEGKLANRHEMGAIIWGAISAEIGISTNFLYRTMPKAHQMTEGNGEELNEMNMWRWGRTVYGVNGETPALEWNLDIIDTRTFDSFNGLRGTIYKIQRQGDDPTKK